MTEYDIVNEFLKSPQAVVVAGATIIGIGSYVLGRIKGGRDKDLIMQREKTRQLELEVEGKRVDANVELKRMNYENAEEMHDRVMEAQEVRRTNEVEDIERHRKYKLEDEQREETRKKEERDYQVKEREEKRELEREVREAKMQRIEAIKGEIGTAIKDYLARVEDAQKEREGVNQEYRIQREEFRKKIVDDVIKSADEGDGFIKDLVYEEINVFDEGVMERVESVVDAKFPLEGNTQFPEPPKEVKELIELLKE